jgi:hypothetical protein
MVTSALRRPIEHVAHGTDSNADHHLHPLDDQHLVPGQITAHGLCSSTATTTRPPRPFTGSG